MTGAGPPTCHGPAIYQLDGGASRNFYDVFIRMVRFRAAIPATRCALIWSSFSSHDLGATRDSGISYRIIHPPSVEFGGGLTDGVVGTSRPKLSSHRSFHHLFLHLKGTHFRSSFQPALSILNLMAIRQNTSNYLLTSKILNQSFGSRHRHLIFSTRSLKVRGYSTCTT
jgi:hypothetical protein